VTQSFLGTLLTCPERARLAYPEGYSQRGSTQALEFGTLVHKVLDATYTHCMQRAKQEGDEALLGFWDHELPIWLEELFAELEALDRHRINEEGDATALAGLEMDYGLAEVLLPPYFRRWAAEFDGYEWLSLEETFDVPYNAAGELNLPHLNPPADTFRVRGKFDGVLRIRGKLWLFETKTKGQVDEGGIVDVMAHELQVMLYLWAIKQVYGETPAGVVYNIIRRPQLRMGAKETLHGFLERVKEDIEARPDFYFLRFNCEIDAFEQEAFMPSFHSIMRMAVMWQEGQYNYKNSHACNLPGRKCKFLPVCSRGDYIGLKRRSAVFPELAEVGTEDD